MESSIASQSIDDLLAVKVESISLLSSPPSPPDTTDTFAQSAAVIIHTPPLPVEVEEEEVEKVAIAAAVEVDEEEVRVGVVVGDGQVSTPSMPPENIISNSSGSTMEVVDNEKDENESDSVVVTEDVCMEDPPQQSNPVQIGQVEPVSLHTYIYIHTYINI
jgi:hypothetical protein